MEKAVRHAIERAGLPERRGYKWIRQIIRPDGHPMKSRHPIPWTEKESGILCIAAALRRLMGVQELRGAVEFMKTCGNKVIAQGRFCVVDISNDGARLIKVFKAKGAALDLIKEDPRPLVLIPVPAHMNGANQ